MNIPGLDAWVKPNIRQMFLPDPDCVLFEVDLAQSDAQVVAWEAHDQPLMDLFIAARTDPTIDLHTTNANDIYGLMGRKPTHNQRQMAKHGVHALNFGATPRTLAKKLDMTVHQATQFHARWFQLHPAIKKWHERVEHELMTTRTQRNKFGYRKIFFGRINNILGEALAWVPQSTTVNVIDKGFNNLCENLPWVQCLMQVHDSIVGQFPEAFWHRRDEIRQQTTIEVPYDEPLIIPPGLAASRRSWGDATDCSWTGEEPIPT